LGDLLNITTTFSIFKLKQWNYRHTGEKSLFLAKIANEKDGQTGRIIVNIYFACKECHTAKTVHWYTNTSNSCRSMQQYSGAGILSSSVSPAG